MWKNLFDRGVYSVKELFDRGIYSIKELFDKEIIQRKNLFGKVGKGKKNRPKFSLSQNFNLYIHSFFGAYNGFHFNAIISSNVFDW